MSGLVAGAKKVPRKIFGREAASLDGRRRRPRAGRRRRRADDSTTPWSTAAAAVVERAGARLRLSADHTVVALAGATGSGKSSTFNALCGLDLAAVGVRRPTTSWATACVWGDGPRGRAARVARDPQRHRVLRDSRLDSGQQDKGLDGLVLLDLPDHDSTEVEPPPRGRPADRDDRPDGLGARPAEVRRRGGPRPVPAAAGHPHGRDARRRSTTSTRCPRTGDRAMLDDVRRLLEVDGLGGVPVLATSAHDGGGDRRAAHRRSASGSATRRRSAPDSTGDVSAAAARLARAQR